MECKVRDLTISYDEIGSGMPLLMLHGWPTDHRQMARDFEPLFENRKGWRRIYPDLPGMGKTRAADWITTQDQMLEVVLEFMDAVAPRQRFVVAGASYGGYLARGVIHRRREQIDGLVLLVPSVETDDAKKKYPPHQTLVANPDFIAALRPEEQDLVNLIVVQSRELLDSARTVIRPAVAIADHEFLNRLEANHAFSFEVDALPAPFLAPTLIVTGRQDSVCGYREAWQILNNYPRATFVVLDRAGHALGFEQRTLFRALANEWLDRVAEYKANA